MTTKNLIFAAIALVATLSLPAYAAKTYTPQQLRKMVNSGKPPKQGSPTTQTQAMSFGSCVAKVNSVVDSVKDQYPAKIIVQTKIMHMAKVWTNDGAMTLSCSQPDSKLVITNAKYL
jgi:hypothetical protein